MDTVYLAKNTGDKLPLIPDNFFASPNCFLRSALFGVVQKGYRLTLKNQLVFSQNGIGILYTGEQLDQFDFDVLHIILAAASRNWQGFEASMVMRKIVLQLGRKANRDSYARVTVSLNRMLDAIVEIRHEDRHFKGTIISAIGDRASKPSQEPLHVSIDPKIANLFGQDGWTLINAQERRQLPGDLAKWLHAFYSSHAKPFPMKVETLHHLCWSQCIELKKFRYELRQALKRLEQFGWIWNIDEYDLVHVGHPASPSQNRLLKYINKFDLSGTRV